MTEQRKISVEPLVEPLTRRERDVLALLAESLTAPEMAERLVLALSTVKYHLQHVYDKLGVNSKRQAVARAGALGLLGTRRAQPDAAPRETTEPAPRHNLPLEVTRFFGREAEISQLKDRLAEVRLVTLTGSGGVGKTRLALRTAEALLPDFTDGVWFVQFALLTDPGLVAQTVATTLEVPEAPGRASLSLVLDQLRDQETLLILDNCEHLVDACAHLADAILRTAPNVRLLATSREALGTQGEFAFRVPSLSTPDPNRLPALSALAQFDAVRLFVERAGRVVPGFQVTPQNALPLARVCQQLDGIPLAIELVAARVQLLRVDQIAERLAVRDSFILLTGGSRTVASRHKTLQALIDWSHDLLTEPEQVLLRRLSVFAGGWTLEAAEWVTGGETQAGGQPPSRLEPTLPAADILELLTQLVNKSLVVADRQQGAETRYHLLETIRQYSWAKLTASGEAETLRLRHAVRYLEFAQHEYAFARESVNHVRTEHDNLRAALTWCQSAPGAAEIGLRLTVALYGFWFTGGLWREGRAYLEGMLAHPEAANSPRAQAQARLQLGDLAGLQGDFDAAEAQMTESLAFSQAHDDLSGADYARQRLARTAREHDNAPLARQLLEQSLAGYMEREETWGIAWASLILGEVLVMQDEVDLADQYVTASLSIFIRVGDSWGTGFAHNHLGHVAQLRRDFEEAHRQHHEGLRLFRQFGAQNMGLAWAYHGLGETALGQGDAQRAGTNFSDGLLLYRDFGDHIGMAWCLAGLAAAAALDEQGHRAAWLWGAATALRQSIRSREGPAAQVTHQRLQAAAREQVGDAAFAAAWAEGQAASTETAITRALSSDE